MLLEFCNISWDENLKHIVIPIYDTTGEKYFLINIAATPILKMVRNINMTKEQQANFTMLILSGRSENIIVCEGELDSLIFLTKGFIAVSSTGGAGTFLEQWAQLLENKNVYICYDNDDAGAKGALRAHALMSKSKIVFLPSFNIKEHRDATDYFKTHTTDDFRSLIAQSESFFIPLPLKEMPKTKKK